MIAIDTNILVRFLTKDDLPQYERAVQLFQHSSIYICKTVLLETNWVLQSCYHYDPVTIANAFEKLSRLPNVVLEDKEAVEKSIQLIASGLSFADALHLSSMPQTTQGFYTFDRDFIVAASSVSLPVFTPPEK